MPRICPGKVAQMPAGRPAIDPDDLKDLIYELWLQDLLIDSILSIVDEELVVRGLPQCARRTL